MLDLVRWHGQRFRIGIRRKEIDATLGNAAIIMALQSGLKHRRSTAILPETDS